MKWLAFLTDKPWLPQPAGTVPELTGPALIPASKIALNVLLGIISVFFLLIFVTFITRSQYEDFQALAGEPWQPFTDATRLWINTLVLTIASIAMHLAAKAARNGQRVALLGWLSIGALGAVGFLILQFTVWQFLFRLGYGVNANPANSYFFMLTGLHALHLIGGLIALGRIALHLGPELSGGNYPASAAGEASAGKSATWMLRSRLQGRIHADPAEASPAADANQSPPTQTSHSKKLTTAITGCATYWHYLLILWLVLFFMLTRTPATYAFIAAACGLG